MMLPQFEESPFNIQLSFHKIIEGLEKIAASETSPRAEEARSLLAQVAAHPEVRNGIKDVSTLKENETLISLLVSDLFPPALTLNEIKAVSIPFLSLIFNYTQRFQNILNAAGPGFEINIRDLDHHQFYVMTCCIILNVHYNTSLNFSKPLFYDIPTADGITKHYRILYNVDFMEITPTEKAVKLSQEEVQQLIDNYDNLDLWKEKFPPGSWDLRGFALMSLYDATTENALSILKGTLLGFQTEPDLHQTLESIFQSIFNIPDIHVGFTAFEPEEGKFTTTGFIKKFKSHMLPEQFEDYCTNVLRSDSYQLLIKDNSYFAISDVSEMVKNNPDSKLLSYFKVQKIESFVLAPVVKNGNLLGILELVSCRANDFNSVNAKKLDIIMPFIIDTIDRKVGELQNQIQAIIQNYYTTLHPSVHWKFKREAQNFIIHHNSGFDYELKEIRFKEVYPLYGQIDIKDSSITRNSSVKADLINQLKELVNILEKMCQREFIDDAEEQLNDLKAFLEDLSIDIKADTEQHILGYINNYIYPIFNQLDSFSYDIREMLTKYFDDTDQQTGGFYSNRRDYEKTLSVINEKLASILDKRQAEIQQYFPHYYERFKTDGVEHNLYIGNSITPNKGFNYNHLQHLRLWQLQVLSEMTVEEHFLKADLPYHLNVTGLLLVFSAPLAIRFRMDEKHFDVDGAYNIRYEVIKKRIDKAFIKGTTVRITQPGKIVIVYSKYEEEEEYRKYIELLQAKHVLAAEIEQFEIEDLQAVSGLKALRVKVLNNLPTAGHYAYSYNDLYHQLNAINS
ncbi:GAF domain-containing protein [Mucilaginibacter agri]|uniref:GAF domain-containing protein n=1 Tax=Mucilaginibacter agri TaxID=2695265 RepID=A0A965ZK30_9SPHI|nr:GAF domain-containing protein [Mucilaginibacter agri]NCD71503.1 GAF domain-containing protein [Mucilaginibacter agri]